MPVYVRVKRTNSQAPIGSFRAERLFKRTGRNKISTSFRYIGTQQCQVDSIDVNVEKPKKILQKQCTLSWNTEQTAILEQPGLRPIPCQVTVKTLKRPAQPDSDTVTSTTDSNITYSPPSKVLRIMDISPNQDVTQLAENVEIIRLLDDSICSTASMLEERKAQQMEQFNFVFDLYKEEEELDEYSDSVDEEYKLTKLGYKIHGNDYYVMKESNFWYDHDDNEENNPEEICDDDEDDSNSESNWRNDYPDEQDFSSSSSHSSSSNSGRSSRSRDDDDDYCNYW